jgi:hypothetical protein
VTLTPIINSLRISSIGTEHHASPQYHTTDVSDPRGQIISSSIVWIEGMKPEQQATSQMMLIRLYGTHRSMTKPTLIENNTVMPMYARKTYISKAKRYQGTARTAELPGSIVTGNTSPYLLCVSALDKVGKKFQIPS